MDRKNEKMKKKYTNRLRNRSHMHTNMHTSGIQTLNIHMYIPTHALTAHNVSLGYFRPPK